MTQSAAESTCAQACDACRNIGLAIHPLRYALAWEGEDVPDGQRTPELSGEFSAAYPALGNVPAHYTLRLLRAGYLYVYDEKSDYWTAYEVGEAGYLRPFDFYGKAPPPNSGEPPAVPCGRHAGSAMARCIQVPDAENAGRLWLALTDTAWTDAIKKDHEDAGHRKLHMRCIDIEAWVASQGGKAQPHSAGLGQVFDQVAEYTLDPAELRYVDADEMAGQSTVLGVDKTFQPVQARAVFSLISSPFSVASVSRNDFLGLLWGKSPDDPQPAPIPPIMVALDDPAGVAAELGALMNDRLQALLQEKDRIRPLAVSMAITQLRDAVGQQDVYDSIEMMDDSAERMSSYIMERTGSDVMLFGPQLKLDAADLESIRAKSWDRYAAKYDVAAQQAWQQQHDADMTRLDEAIISPLAVAHKELLQSPCLRKHLACNYDRAHPHSGHGYQAVVARCLAGTQDKGPCAELYQQWLCGDANDHNNLILRAYALNLDTIAGKVVEAAAEPRVKLGELPWDSLVGLYAEAGNQIGKAGLTGTVATLVETTVGVLAKPVGSVVDGAARASLQALVALGMGIERPLQWVSTQATTREIVAGVMEALSQTVSRKVRRHAIKLELRRLEILGVKLDERHAVGFVGVLEDGDLITQATHRARQADFIRKKLSSWRRMMNTDVRAGMVGGMLQALAMIKLYKTATGGMKHERIESWQRLSTAAVGTFGGVMELGGEQVERLANANLRYARWLRYAEVASVWGARLVAVGGFVMAAIDLKRGLQENRQGNSMMAKLYAGSSMVGVFLTIAVLAGWFAVAGLLFIVALALAVAIMWLGDDARQDWLERTLWGKIGDPSEKYRTVEEDMQQYKIAVGAA